MPVVNNDNLNKLLYPYRILKDEVTNVYRLSLGGKETVLVVAIGVIAAFVVNIIIAFVKKALKFYILEDSISLVGTWFLTLFIMKFVQARSAGKTIIEELNEDMAKGVEED